MAISERLRSIIDAEIARGNALDGRGESGVPPRLRRPWSEVPRTLIDGGWRWVSSAEGEGVVEPTTGEQIFAPARPLPTRLNEAMPRIAPSLRPLLEAELAAGNEVSEIAIGIWTACPLAITLKRPLNRSRSDDPAELPPGVRWWESRDPHYAIEAGYACEVTRQTLAGPLAE